MSSTTEQLDSDTAKTGTTSTPKVILNCFKRVYTCPSASPFVLKLETYLRMAEIPHEIKTEKPFGPKGKSPWIEYDGVTMGDSELIIQFLNKKFERSLWGNATKAEKATAQSMRIMLEEHLVCGLAEWRYIDGVDRLSEILEFEPGIKIWVMKKFMARKVRNSLNTQGIGLHTPEERLHLFRQDLEAVSDYLGSKQFFFGDKPTEIDAAVFGVLAQFLWVAPGSELNRMITEEMPNVVAYLHRMKERFWPDWDSLLIKKA